MQVRTFLLLCVCAQNIAEFLRDIVDEIGLIHDKTWVGLSEDTSEKRVKTLTE